MPINLAFSIVTFHLLSSSISVSLIGNIYRKYVTLKRTYRGSGIQAKRGPTRLGFIRQIQYLFLFKRSDRVPKVHVATYRTSGTWLTFLF